MDFEKIVDNMMDGHHQLAMMQQQHQNHGQQQAATSESDARGPRHDELLMESKSGSDNMEGGARSGGSGGEELQEEDLGLRQPARKKRYHRHTQHQIQELEAFFKEYPHPDDKQRKELSRELGLEPLQVKFWFQNKRTQMKTQQERHENMQLRAENEKLRAENARYKDALANASCPSCGGPAATAVIGEMSFDEHHLRVENARLRDEVDRISTIAAKYVGKPAGSLLLLPPNNLSNNVSGPALSSHHHLLPGGTDVFGGLHRHAGGGFDFDKGLVVELAVAAMEELVRMALLGEPLWIPALAVDGATTETLNEEEYARGFFPRGVGPKLPELRSEASREAVVVIMNHVSLIEMLMDVTSAVCPPFPSYWCVQNQWSTLFSSIVSRAATLEVLSTGVAGNYNGALQLMTAEFQMPSPLVPTRECQFLRYCKQHTDGSWAVVDVSVEGQLLRTGSRQGRGRGRRRPSGCLIQEMPNGYSRVTWVEHAEADDMMVHDLYRPLVCSGLAFGARRWASTLERQCERLASAMASGVVVPAAAAGPAAGVVTSPEGRRSMMRLAERMVASFCGGVTASTTHQWTTLSGSGAEDVRVMTRKSVDDPGRPPGIILNAATSFWLPVAPARVFGFLRDDATRSEWDMLSNGGDVQEMAHIANGRDHGNAVSLLRVDNANSNQGNMLILQECCTDATGSYVIYAPVDVVAMNVVLNGGDPDYVALLPSGFAILPDGGGGGGGGSLLTVAFQILVDSVPTAKLSLGSVATVNSLIACTVERIKAAVAADNAGVAAAAAATSHH
ncbi:homeobox-leucine zipper protein ROC7 isoform X3 [Zea mays]|uniref:homeobox-leucine zipper protein ROC7 isoform X3 n=1 Tax=Zea mays TaxID=4577 RepID=UPI0004DEAF58|nr:homeobox-leucine zipper protein ROC7 isoform X3 [Zea mays]|eukprot:XP_020401599.1 homeobox-leucine zipper protein ROC7 isoform X3 [Zea mays]